MAKTKAVPMTDKKWEEENDARTVAEAHAILADKKRKAGAARGAKRIITEQEQKLKGLRKVARKKK